MDETTREIVIRNDREEVVARMQVRNGVLHGHCEWYNGLHRLVSYGHFEDGSPYTGTFLNWSKFFSGLHEDNPFDLEAYCRELISVFEASFLSERPTYEIVIEAYYQGTALLQAT